jgi:murein DD-endopeptidase MepM/ murein hydrolase activator NlpD
VYKARLFTCALITLIALQGMQGALATATSQSDAKQRLKEIEKKRAELQRQADEVRRKEQAALRQLHQINGQLRETKGALNDSQDKLHKTETKIRDCEVKITQTKTQEEVMSDQAGSRLRQIYEGQRLGLLEMMFQVSSLQSLLDLFYYQERIAEADRKLLDNLRAKAAALEANKHGLANKKNHLGDLVSDFAKKAMALTNAKSSQEQVAEKLRSQRAFYEMAEQTLANESAVLEKQIYAVMNSETGKSMKQCIGQLSMPLKAAITSPFGYRRHPIFGVRKFHSGIDLAGPNHSPIHAADSGTVLKSGSLGGYGRVVIVSHGKGMATLYAHLAKSAVSEGQNVQKGEVIGYEGSTGFSTGPHLHFEVRIDGKPNNPLNYVK